MTFGNQDPNPGAITTPSILSLVVEQCVEDLAPIYHPCDVARWCVTVDGAEPIFVTDVELAEDIGLWVKALEGDDAIGSKIVTLIRNNPGWAKVIARRVMKQLRAWN
jgi:hypothetical protein